MSKTTRYEKRTDIHRVGAIVPADYEYLRSYSLAGSEGGWPVPAYGINCELDYRTENKKTGEIKNGEHRADGRCCVIGFLHHSGLNRPPKGAPGTCTVCGTWHRHGDIWLHKPTDTFIFVGHQCADKYELIADRQQWERDLGNVRERSAREHAIAMRQEEREDYLAATPKVAAALACDGVEKLVQIREAFMHSRYTSLTEKQEKYVLALHHRFLHPEEEKPKVPAQIEEGKRQVIEGTIISVKEREDLYRGGVSYKMTMSIPHGEGEWLCWGTAPAALWPIPEGKQHRGSKIRIKTRRKQGRDEYFALSSRPSLVDVIEWANAEE